MQVIMNTYNGIMSIGDGLGFGFVSFYLAHFISHFNEFLVGRNENDGRRLPSCALTASYQYQCMLNAFHYASLVSFLCFRLLVK